MRTMTHVALILVLVGATVIGCDTAEEPAPPSSGPLATSPTRSPGPGPSGAAADRGRGGAPTAAPSTSVWSSAPVTVVHTPAVPPVPVLRGVRYAAHPAEGFDRIVFDIDGAAPGYRARYVDRVTADPSDKPVSVPGRRHLLIAFEPAQAHRDDGAATVSGVHRVGLPMLQSYAVVGDFEGVVTIALGLDDVVGYRIGEVPGRIYLDVAA